MQKTCMITDIQRYCIHDGDGIRTTVFFKGCPLHCSWCHNPETQSDSPQLLDRPDRCTGCQACVLACPLGAVKIEAGIAVTDRNRCNTCGTCTEYCLSGLREVSGKKYTVKQLFDDLRRDEMFYQDSGGGVTLSGGEVMTSDIDFLEELVKKLYRYGISINIDTCGLTEWSRFERIFPYIDTFLYDIKMIDEDRHKRYTGSGNALILENLSKLNDAGAKIYIRIPTILEVNGDAKSMERIIGYLKEKQISPAKIHLLPYHNTGSTKYARLGNAYPGEAFHAPSEKDMQGFVEQFKDAGYANTYIGG